MGGFTTLLSGRSRFGASFWDIFSILVALSPGAVLRLIEHHYSRRKCGEGGRKEHKAEIR